MGKDRDSERQKEMKKNNKADKGKDWEIDRERKKHRKILSQKEYKDRGMDKKKNW